MNEIESEAVYKLSIQDLCSFRRCNDAWSFAFEDASQPVNINAFQIQVTICKVSGLNNEIMIVSDETGKAKVTRGPKVPGEFSWVKPGAYCSIVGSLLEGGKLPHVNIIKLGKINNEILKEMWPLEVAELKRFITKKIIPDITALSPRGETHPS